MAKIYLTGDYFEDGGTYARNNYISLCEEFYKPLKTKYWYSKKFCDIIK